ncbi:MAG: ribosomal protein S19 family protein [Candidatus Micrarchaeia archaeon]
MKQDYYKGYTEEELKKMSFDDFSKIVTSRERRTLGNIKRNPKLKKLVARIRKIKETGRDKLIKTQIRDAIILPEWLGLTFGVYNGKEYKKVTITIKHLGKRLGEFSHSTGPVKHSGPGVGATRGSKFVPLK